MSSPIFLPKILTCLTDYTRAQLGRDLVAGVTVGMVALPLALAFGIASIPESVAAEAGISPPAMGLFTAMVAGLLVSVLGGTRSCIGGPTGAFIVIVYQIAAEHGYKGLVFSTIIAGCLLVLFGVARLGSVIKFIPFPVTTGFTAGIAVIIFTGQVKDLLGMSPKDAADIVPPEFIGKVSWYFTHAQGVHWPTAIMGVACVAVIYLWPRYVTRKLPAPIVVLIGATVIAQVFKLPLETIADRFGAIPSGLPMPKIPSPAGVDLKELVSPALTIALLAAIESLLCAVVADGMLGSKHRSNTELIAQGAANIISPLFGGIPATGAIARTATNIQAGGRTPIAGITHAVTLALVVVLVGRYAAMVPLCVLSAVLVIVAWNMSEIHRVLWILRGPRSDAAVMIATLALTVFTDLTIAVQTGMVLAAILFIKRMSDVTSVTSLRPNGADERKDVPLDELKHPAVARDVEVYDINGPFFFGAAYKLREVLDQIGKPPKTLVLNLTNVMAMDSTGLHSMEELRTRCVRDGTRLILVGVHAQPLTAMTRARLLEEFGESNLVGTIDEALRLAAGTAPEGAGGIGP